MEFKRDLEMVKGDVSPILNISLANFPIMSSEWTGRLVVTPKLGSGVYLVDKSVVLDSTNKFFIAFLSPEESNLLPPGNYFLIVEILNTELFPPVRLEAQYRLQILPGGIINH